jgi:hypothetical protein
MSNMKKRTQKPIASINVLYATEDMFTKRTRVIFDLDLDVKDDIKKGTIQVIFFKYIQSNINSFSNQFSWTSNFLTEISDAPDWLRKKYPNAVTFQELQKLGENKIKKFTESNAYKQISKDPKKIREIQEIQKGLPRNFIGVVDVGEEFLNCYIPIGKSRFYISSNVQGWDFLRINIKGQLGKLFVTQKSFQVVLVDGKVQTKSQEQT